MVEDSAMIGTNICVAPSSSCSRFGPRTSPAELRRPDLILGCVVRDWAASPWHQPLVRVAVCVLLFALAVKAQLRQYEQASGLIQSSGRIYDARQVVRPEAFTTAQLSALFSQFASARCGQGRLARLTVTTNLQDLINTSNVSLPEMPRKGIPNILKADPSLIGIGLNEPSVAQVLCFDGQASAFVRHGGQVSEFRISGSRDPRELILGELHARIVGFRLRPALTGTSHSASDVLSVYVRMSALPELVAAKAAHAELALRTGSWTVLVLRTDPFFFDYDGPRTDLFEKSIPNASSAEFLVRPYIVCWPEGKASSCKLLRSHTGGDAPGRKGR
jgi:hypothetical protein